MYDKLTIINRRIKRVHKELLYDTANYTPKELAIELCNIILEELEIDIEEIKEEL